MGTLLDIPDEVVNDALRVALELGRYPQWYLDLRAGKYGGRLPGRLTAAERAEIERNRMRTEGMRREIRDANAPVRTAAAQLAELLPPRS